MQIEQAKLPTGTARDRTWRDGYRVSYGDRCGYVTLLGADVALSHRVRPDGRSSWEVVALGAAVADY